MTILDRSDEDFMRLALLEARKAFAADEVPIGAIIIQNRQVIAKAHNQVETLKDATAHAEILAITQASSILGDWRLNTATIYVSKEPCAMCAGAMLNCRLKRLVFGAYDPRSGAAGSALNITGFEGSLQRISVRAGILERSCLELLQSFFQQRRKEKEKQ